MVSKWFEALAGNTRKLNEKINDNVEGTCL